MFWVFWEFGASQGREGSDTKPWMRIVCDNGITNLVPRPAALSLGSR